MVAGNRNLQADVDELRRSAMSARAQMMVEQATKERDIAERGDVLRARQRSAEHAARDTEVEAAKAVEASQYLESLDKSLLRDSEAAKASGDLARAEELWEQHLGVSTDFEVARGRAARLSNEAKQHAAEAAALTEPIREVDRELTRFASALYAAEQEVDNLDKKALLLEQAQKKFAEAEANANPDAQREAQGLLEQAEAIKVDEAKIEAVTDSWETPELGGGPTTPMSLPDAEPRVPPVKPTPKPADPDGPLPDDVDVAAEQRELTTDIDALRHEASSARAAVLARVEDRAKELGLLRDQTAREQWAAEQASKAAQMQVQRETREVNEAKATAERLNRDADAAASRGDHTRAESLREDADAAAMEQRVREARLAAAETEASQQGTLAASLKQDIRALEVTYDEVLQSRRTAESALDNLEEKALLLEQARQKFGEAEQKDSARALREAQELVNRAEKLNVDRDAVRQILPEFPAETPGVDDTNLVFDVPAGLDGRVAALTADAAAARNQLVEAVATRSLDDLREGDRLRMEKAAADEAAETVELRRKGVDEAKARIAEQEREAQAAEAAGDVAKADEIREDARTNSAILEQRERLLIEAEQAEAALKPRTDEVQRRLDEINAAKTVDEQASDAAEAELDKLEQQAVLLDQARQKFAEANQTRDPATLRSAQALLVQADAITVDRAVVHTYLPDFPLEPPAALEPTVESPTTPAVDSSPGDSTDSTLVPGASVLGDDIDGLNPIDDEQQPDVGVVETPDVAADEIGSSEFERAIAAADSLSDQFGSFFDAGTDAVAPTDGFATADTFAEPSFDSSLADQPDDFGVDSVAAFSDEPASSSEAFDA